MKNTITLLRKILLHCIPKVVMALAFIIGLTGTSYAQVPECDSVYYELDGLQPDSIIMVSNGHPSGTVISWDWTITSVNTQTVIYTSTTGPYLFVPPLLYSQNEAYEVCLVTVNQLNTNIFTCIQCDIVSWDSLANSWVISPAPSCNVAVTSTNASNNITNDGSATAIPDNSGTPPYTYVWNTGEFTSTIDSLAVGTYCVTVTDSNNCSATGCTTVGSSANTPCSISITATDATCGTCTDGSASVLPSGGTPPYTYLWNTGVYTSTIDSLAVGTYCVTVTDADTCAVTGCVTVSNQGSNCSLIPDIGPCMASIDKYYFDQLTQQCDTFTWGGCDGVVPFNTLVECQLECESGGSCNASFYPFVDSNLIYTVYLIENSTGNNLAYFWDFGDGNTSTQQFPTHVYSNFGSYDICLTISDNMNCISTSCVTLLLDSVQKNFTGFTLIVVPQEPVISGLAQEPKNNIVEKLRIYPNPTTGILSIDGIEGIAKLYDAYGRLVKTSPRKSIDIQDLSNGIYFLRIQNAKGKIYTMKVFKE